MIEEICSITNEGKMVKNEYENDWLSSSMIHCI